MSDLLPILKGWRRDAQKNVRRLEHKPLRGKRIGQARANGRAEGLGWAIAEIEERLQDGRLVDMD